METNFTQVDQTIGAVLSCLSPAHQSALLLSYLDSWMQTLPSCLGDREVSLCCLLRPMHSLLQMYKPWRLGVPTQQNAALRHNSRVLVGTVTTCWCNNIKQNLTVFNTGRSRTRPNTGNRLRKPSTTGKKPLKSSQNPYVSTQIPTSAHLTRISVTPTRKHIDPCRNDGATCLLATWHVQNMEHDCFGLHQ